MGVILEQFNVEAEFYFADFGEEAKPCHNCGSNVLVLKFTDQGNIEDAKRAMEQAMGQPVPDEFFEGNSFYECLNCASKGMYGAGFSAGEQSIIRKMMGGMG